MAIPYIVKNGDCLWHIAKTQLGNGTRYTEITRADGQPIKSPYLIRTGETLYLPSDGESSDPINTTSRPIDVFVGLMAGTDKKTLYATWVWSKDHTKSYKIKWYYDPGNNVWFVGNESEITVDADKPDDAKQSTYQIPDNANFVMFTVKPVSDTYKSGKNDVDYWTADWSTNEIVNVVEYTLDPPPVPTVTIDNCVLTAEISNLDTERVDKIEFQIIKDDEYVFNTEPLYATINASRHVSISYEIEAGHKYSVWCRTVWNTYVSKWSNLSDNVIAVPNVPDGITLCQAKTSTSVYLEWTAVGNAKTYDLEYATDSSYFDNGGDAAIKSGIEYPHYELTGLETGKEYFFRVRAVNESGTSGWSSIVSVPIGTSASAPTTWSSTTTAIVGEPLNLYWVHNSEDNSSMTFAMLGITIDDGEEFTYVVKRSETPGSSDVVLEWQGASFGTLSATKTTNACAIDTSVYQNGTNIKWRVKTTGVTKELAKSVWSTLRTVDVYAKPTVSMSVKDITGNLITTITSFPLNISALTGPRTQAPIGYHLTMTANESYETIDRVGNIKIVQAGEIVYSRHFDISKSLDAIISAGDVDLKNNIHYTLVCTAAMNSGLTAEQSIALDVAWVDNAYEPNAEIGIDHETVSAYIRPYCEDEHGKLIDDIVLAVYRRESDGSFKEIASGIDNQKYTFVTDPHPSLDLARYRIVATTKSTGSVSYCDLAGVPVDEKSIIIQWDEAWSNFDVVEQDVPATRAWSGSLLRLPFNIDVSEKYNADVSLIEYVGRKHPVSYYGTQLGESSTWNFVIDKKDRETLYAIRRLSTWMGDAYVREPSGNGYWAKVAVSFSQKHLELTIPVTLDIKRVEGGI